MPQECRSHTIVVVALAGLALGTARPLAAQQPITLAQAVAMAQQQGLQAKAAREARDAARYRHGAFSARLLPQLSLTGTVPSYNRSIIPVQQPDGSTLFRAQQQTNTDLTMTLSQQLPVTGGNLFLASSLARYKVSGALPYETWSSSPVVVGLRQNIFRPNTAGWDRREQDLQAELAERTYLESMETIALQTTTSFFNVYAAQVGLDNARKNAAVNDSLYTLNTGRYQIGKIAENELLQSELALLKARNALQSAQLEYDRSLEALKLALNLSSETPLEIAVSTSVPDIQVDTAKAVAEALRNRAAVSQVALQDVQARREVAVAKLSNGIGATIQASYGLNATAPTSNLVYQNLLQAQQFSLSVSIPLWQWGAHSQGVKAAEADQRQEASLSEATIEQAAHDAHFGALTLEQARRTVALSAKADTVAGKRFDVAYNRYRIGRITIENLYIAQQEKDQALTQFVNALRGYWMAYYDLRRLTLYDFEADHPIEAP
jgi:outer membrane protein